MCDPGAVGLNCSRDVECRYWVDSRKRWEREGCRTVEPPYGKFDGFLHCECYMTGTIAGVVFPWVVPPPPIVYDIFANADILQNLPAIAVPFNVQLIVTLVAIVFFNVLSLGWAKFRVHRRAVIQQRANDARRKLSRMDFVSSTIGDESEPQYVPPTKGALQFVVSKRARKPGDETSGKKKLGTGDMLRAVVVAAQRRAQSLPSESIQERVPIAALVEASRTNEAVSAEGVVADGLESPPVSRRATPLASRPGEPVARESEGSTRRHSMSPRTLVRPSDGDDNQECGQRHSWSPAEAGGPPPPVANLGPGTVQQCFSMVPLSAAPQARRTRVEMVREQLVREQPAFRAMREQQACGRAGTPPPPQLPRIVQNRIPNLSPKAGTLSGFVARRTFASQSALPVMSHTPPTRSGIPSRRASAAPGAGYVSPYAQRPCRGTLTPALTLILTPTLTLILTPTLTLILTRTRIRTRTRDPYTHP